MLEAGELHGYAMTSKIREYSDGGLNLPAGSLYPALHKLERAGLVTSTIEQESARKRRTYSLTTQGTDVLMREIKSWRVIVKTMNALMGIA